MQAEADRASAPGVPIAGLDFVDPAFAADPYPFFDALRRQGPITFHEGIGKYLVTEWRDCTAILLNQREFMQDEAGFIDLFGGRTMECMERDRHGEVRGIWARDFERATLDRARAMVADVVRARIGPFVDRVRAGETVDAVSGMTRGIPTIVIANMLGIDAGDYEMFGEWSDAMGNMAEGVADPGPRGQDILRKGREATLALNTYIRDRLPARRGCPRDDLISRMVSSPVAGRMEEAEIVASNTQLVFAGNETTAKLMATTLCALARHPDQRRAIVADRSLVPKALEEIHRWMTVVHINGRTARGGNATAAGHRLRDGEQVMILLGAANRDPARWEHPDRLDIFRPQRPHLGFGFGMHVCLGLHLARLESEIWLDLLLDALPEWEIGEVDWGTNWAVRGPLRIDVARG